MWRAGIIDCHSVQCSLVIDTQPCLLTYLLKGWLCVSGEDSRGVHIIGALTCFLNRGPAESKSGPVLMCNHCYKIIIVRTVRLLFDSISRK